MGRYAFQVHNGALRSAYPSKEVAVLFLARDFIGSDLNGRLVTDWQAWQRLGLGAKTDAAADPAVDLAQELLQKVSEYTEQVPIGLSLADFNIDS